VVSDSISAPDRIEPSQGTYLSIVRKGLGGAKSEKGKKGEKRDTRIHLESRDARRNFGEKGDPLSAAGGTLYPVELYP